MGYTIWKAVLKATDIQDIEVPEDSEILTARDQHNEMCVWFKCDPERRLTKRRIAIVGTGHPAPEGASYVGTGFLHGGQIVFHVFERIHGVVGGSQALGIPFTRMAAGALNDTEDKDAPESPADRDGAGTLLNGPDMGKGR